MFDLQKKSILTHTNTVIPINTIFCIGQNYSKHIQELDSTDLGAPLIFTKPINALIQHPTQIKLPPFSDNVHHEVELVVLIGKQGIAGAGVGLDLTCRDIQNQAKKDGSPWTISKGFDHSAPISFIYDITDINQLSHTNLFLEKNGKLVQTGNTNQMIFNISYLISYLSRFFTLTPGDLLFTGTPQGVGPIQTSDQITFWADFSEKTTIQFIR